MTQNKRRKNKIRAHMEATGDNYVRAAREVAPAPLKDPATLSWSPGTFTSGEKATDSFVSADEPHLLITGMSSAEPELMLHDMLNQLIDVNAPEDAKFWFVTPKFPHKGFETSSHVERYVDSWTPDSNFFSNVAGLMDNAVAEMNRRNALMVNHKDAPKNLRRAREIAIRESQKAGTPVTDHELYFPFLLIAVQEIGSLFNSATGREDRILQNRILAATTELARKSRSAGIFMAATTEQATTSNVPTLIANNMRRIGLTMPNEIGSRLAVGSDDLVTLPKTKAFIVLNSPFGTLSSTIERNQDYYPYSTGLNPQSVQNA